MMQTISPKLAETLYRLSTQPTIADQLTACDLYAELPQATITATERFVRSCLVSQGLAA